MQDNYEWLMTHLRRKKEQKRLSKAKEELKKLDPLKKQKRSILSEIKKL